MKITGFQGIRPRTAPRLLGETAAQVAANTDLSSGEARPLSQPALAYTPNVSTKPGPHLALYKADPATATRLYDLWFSWNRDVDVCRSPLPGEKKWIFTGDGEPRITNEALAIAGAGDNYPATCQALGLPKPITGPTVVVTPAGTAGTPVSRYYAYTFYDDWNQESAFSPHSTLVTGDADDSWAVTTLDAAPPNTGAITALTYGGTGNKTITITNAALTFTRAGERIVLSALTGTFASVNGTWVITAVDVALKQITFDVTTAPTGTWASGGTWTREAPWRNATKRLYRTSGTKAQFQLVAEGITDVFFTDTVLDIDILGNEAITATWELPPVDLQGVFTLPSGALCGFSGNETCFSEPFQPHAWPPEYRKRADYPIVAAGLFTSGIVVGTTGVPQVLIGHEPGQMAAQPVTGAYPCLSKRSMSSLGDSVGYASAHGYVRIGDSGVSIMTEETHTRDVWAALAPETMVAETVRGRLYVMTQGAGPSLLIFDFLDGTGLTTADLDATELFADALSGKLYISDSVNQDVREFDPVDGVYMTQDWMSKELVLPNPGCPGAARVNFTARWSQAQYDGLLAIYNAAQAVNVSLITSGRTVELIALGLGDVGGEINGDEFNAYAINESAISEVVSPALESPGVTFTLYVDGEAYYSTVVTNKLGFPLPSGYKHDTFAVRVQGQVLVKSIDMAATMMGLRND